MLEFQKKAIHAANHNSFARIIEGNKKYIQSKLAENPDYFKNLAVGQNPTYLLIGCADSRVPPNELTQTDPGEIFIHRNIANVVSLKDFNLNAVIQYAVEVLKVHHIVILGHTGCGGVKAALSNDSHGSFLDLWIQQIKDVYERNFEKFDGLSSDEKVEQLVKLNITQGVKNIWLNPIVQKAWSNGQPVWVHGWLARIENGAVEEISLDQEMPNSLNLYKFQYHKDQQDHMQKK